MANHIGDRHAVIDTFGADVTLKSGECKVLLITIYAAGAGELATFIDNSGQIVFMVSAGTGLVDSIMMPTPIGVDGLVFDDSASTLEAGDALVVHFA